MCIEILTGKCIVDSLPCREILSCKALGFLDLPERYVAHGPAPRAFSIENDFIEGTVFVSKAVGYMKTFEAGRPQTIRLRLCTPVPNPDTCMGLPSYEAWGACIYLLTPGDIFLETDFQWFCLWLERCGARLTKIRKQQSAEWSGTELIEI